MEQKILSTILEDARKIFKQDGTGLDCPLDTVLFDYVHGTLTEAEQLTVAGHIEKCERCRITELKMDVEQIRWEKTFDRDPDVAISDILGAERAGQLWATIKANQSKTPARALQKKAGVCLEQFRQRIKEGADEIKAALETLQFSLREPMPARGKDKIAKDVMVLGKKAPVYSFSVPENVRYQTLITVQPEKQTIIVLYENFEVNQPFSISPEFIEKDEGKNQLLLLLTETPLPIRSEEEEISPERLIEIIDCVDQKKESVVNFEVDVVNKE